MGITLEWCGIRSVPNKRLRLGSACIWTDVSSWQFCRNVIVVYLHCFRQFHNQMKSFTQVFEGVWATLCDMSYLCVVDRDWQRAGAFKQKQQGVLRQIRRGSPQESTQWTGRRGSTGRCLAWRCTFQFRVFHSLFLSLSINLLLARACTCFLFRSLPFALSLSFSLSLFSSLPLCLPLSLSLSVSLSLSLSLSLPLFPSLSLSASLSLSLPVSLSRARTCSLSRSLSLARSTFLFLCVLSLPLSPSFTRAHTLVRPLFRPWARALSHSLSYDKDSKMDQLTNILSIYLLLSDALSDAFKALHF